jgi:hypothetical protein
VSVIESEAASNHPPWRVRYTWSVVNGAPRHQFTYEQMLTETLAIDRAVSMMDYNDDCTGEYVACTHIQRPGTDDWRQIDYTRQ